MIYLLTHPTRRKGQSLWHSDGLWWTTHGWKDQADRNWSRQTIRGPVAMPMSEVRTACRAAGEPLELWRMNGGCTSDPEYTPEDRLIWSEATDPAPPLFA